MNIVFNHCAVFVCAIVIADNRARANVYVVTHGGITDIAQMVHLAAHTNGARLDFNEIA